MAIRFQRLGAMFRFGFTYMHAKLDPVGFAKSIGVTLGENVHFYGMSHKMFGSEPWLIRLGSDVHITSGCCFVTHDGGTLVLRHRDPTLEVTAPIVVGDRVYVGMNSTILPGVTIGSDVIIGAGSLVTKDIPAGQVAAGVPAKVIKPMEQYFQEISARSLGIGHLGAREKEIELRRMFSGFIGNCSKE